MNNIIHEKILLKQKLKQTILKNYHLDQINIKTNVFYIKDKTWYG